ncbi:MAG: hypothetical protein ABFD75_08410 [Smithella sp.]
MATDVFLNSGTNPLQTWAMGSILGQTHRTLLAKSVCPQKNRRARSVQLFGHGIMGHTLRRKQASARTQNYSLRCRSIKI